MSRFSLAAIFYDGAGLHLEETPLAADQKLKQVSAETHRLTAKVLWTEQLKWWLLGFGDKVEVVKPKALRAELADSMKRAARRYSAR